MVDPPSPAGVGIDHIGPFTLVDDAGSGSVTEGVFVGLLVGESVGVLVGGFVWIVDPPSPAGVGIDQICLVASPGGGAGSDSVSRAAAAELESSSSF